MKERMKMRNMTVIVAVLVAIITLVLFVNTIAVGEVTNGLTGEAGIIKSDGTIIPLQVMPHPLAVWTVNSIACGDGDWLYWRFWLNLKATGVDGSLTNVRYKLWQKFNEGASTWVAGTEEWGDRPQTFSNEVWFRTSLPVDTLVTVPIKYRDDLWFDEPTTMSPYSELSTDGTHAIRAARVEQLNPDAWGEGTSTWEVFCTVQEITWQWKEAGSYKTGSIQPIPYEVSFKFTITKTTAGLTATLESSSSH